jgi:hypothetical protein
MRSVIDDLSVGVEHERFAASAFIRDSNLHHLVKTCTEEGVKELHQILGGHLKTGQ